MRRYSAAVLILGLLVGGVLYYSRTSISNETQPQQFSIDTPQGQAIHRAMMAQMQAAQARMAQKKSN